MSRASLAIAWERPQRRAEERVALRWPVELTALGRTVTLPTVDVSLGGMALLATAPLALPKGERLSLKLPARRGPGPDVPDRTRASSRRLWS